MIETSAKPPIRRSGVSAERRKPLEIEECGFLPKAATLLLQRSLIRSPMGEADLTEASRLLGCEPSHNLAEGLGESLPWYLANLDLVASINRNCYSHAIH